MQKTSKSTGGTSFHGSTVVATVAELKQVLGEPAYSCNDGEDKVNFEWEMETEAGEVFTVYDWKEYRPISENEEIEWHIGGMSGRITGDAAAEVIAELEAL
jgi:hypothetical protein